MSGSHEDYADDQLIINYKDVCIYGRDYQLLLSPTAWINDTILHYQFVRLQEQYSPSHSIVLLDPVVLSCLMHQCDDIDEFIDFSKGCHIALERTLRILLPVNDSMVATSSNWYIPSSTAGMGTHWSLLVLDITDNCATNLIGYHFDSIPLSGNYTAAQHVASKMESLFRILKLPYNRDFVAFDPTRPIVEPKIKECLVPKQQNGYDCGIHVLIHTEIILRLPPNVAIESFNVEHSIHEFITENGSDSTRHQYSAVVRRRIAKDISDQAAATDG
jgi:Ulp1 protease family, C-terminal catalytic domain